MKNIQLPIIALASATAFAAEQPNDHLVFLGDESKPGKNKHIVLIAGDEEYRSEEAMPMLAQILADQGFKCTVLFSMDKDNKFVDPNNHSSLSNPAALDTADTVILSIRFRNWEQKAADKFNAAFERGVSMVGMRTTTHAFKFKKDNPTYAKWSFNSKDANFKKGFGRQVFGESWVSHWGKHAVQGTRTTTAESGKDNTLLNGVGTIFGKTDLYEAKPLEPSTILLTGHITASLEKDSPLVTDGKGATTQPIAWTREYKHASGTTNKIFTTTMGSSDDLLDENLRRLIVNSAYWGTGLEVPEKADATLKSAYNPTMYGTKDHADGIRKAAKKNQTPSDYISIE